MGLFSSAVVPGCEVGGFYEALCGFSAQELRGGEASSLSHSAQERCKCLEAALGAQL